MKNKYNLKVVFMGGRQAGIIGAMTVLSAGVKISAAVSYSQEFADILKYLEIPIYKSINDDGFVKSLRNADILLSVHGREIVKPSLLRLPKLGAINIHPYFYKYKGANPVERALKDKEFKASVAAHLMESKVDTGRVLVEEFIDVSGACSVAEIYNMLYSHYCSVVLKALELISYEKKA